MAHGSLPGEVGPFLEYFLALMKVIEVDLEEDWRGFQESMKLSVNIEDGFVVGLFGLEERGA